MNNPSLKIAIIFFLGLVFLESIEAQAGMVLKNIVRQAEQNAFEHIIRREAGTVIKQEAKTIAAQEAEALARNSIRSADDAAFSSVKSLSQPKNLVDGHKNNLNKFLDECKEVLESGHDVFDYVLNSTEIDEENPLQKNLYVKEIFAHPKYLVLYQEIAKKFKKYNLKKAEVKALLFGYKMNGVGINPKTLYDIYYQYSASFAKEQLEEMIIYYNCDQSKANEIKELAKKRNVKLGKVVCKPKEEEAGTFELILGIAVIIFCVYLIKKAFNFVWNWLFDEVGEKG